MRILIYIGTCRGKTNGRRGEVVVKEEEGLLKSKSGEE
jgi:hypothetical protein